MIDEKKNLKTKPLFIVIEGIDGAGKTILAKQLADHFLKDRPVVLTREPGGSEIGVSIRELLHKSLEKIDKKGQFLLFAADRAQHVTSVIKPALLKGDLVISDRFSDSSIAYQVSGNGLDLSMVNAINTWVMDGVKPDITIFIDITIEEALRRIAKRGGDSVAYEKENFLVKVQKGFYDLYQHREEIIWINGHQDQKTVTQIALLEIQTWLQK